MVTQRWWTINTCWDCCCCFFPPLSLSLSVLWNVQQSSSALVWTSPLLTGTPNPLRPAFSRTRWSDSSGASTHLTVIQLSFCHSWNGDISFKICYSVASLTPPHTAFCFYFLERKKSTRRLCSCAMPPWPHMSNSDLCECACVDGKQSPARRLLSLTWLKITFLYILKFSKILLFAIMFCSFWEGFRKCLFFCFVLLVYIQSCDVDIYFKGKALLGEAYSILTSC